MDSDITKSMELRTPKWPTWWFLNGQKSLERGREIRMKINVASQLCVCVFDVPFLLVLPIFQKGDSLVSSFTFTTSKPSRMSGPPISQMKAYKTSSQVHFNSKWVCENVTIRLYGSLTMAIWCPQFFNMFLKFGWSSFALYDNSFDQARLAKPRIFSKVKLWWWSIKGSVLGLETWTRLNNKGRLKKKVWQTWAFGWRWGGGQKGFWRPNLLYGVFSEAEMGRKKNSKSYKRAQDQGGGERVQQRFSQKP